MTAGPDIAESPSPNQNERALPVSIVVLHYTGMLSAEAARKRLCDPEAEVSAHYLIEEDGQIWRLVPENRRAWHAGRGYWRGVRDVNSASIGIELANPGHEHGYAAFPEAQIEALTRLLPDILERHGVAPENVIGHSDLAPDRKDDPGEKFPWETLAKRGQAEARPHAGGDDIWDDPHWSDVGTMRALGRFGYEADQPERAVTAFQRRWRPDRVDGTIDAETRTILLALLSRRSAGALRLGTHLPRP
ncbi:N-acetylmuramoyl-L-alanine amidase [Pacificimonas flava]|uniref:N-acetylmuramoyl-L-alanine amidase n=1 Tax=Pacificimonas flava TaxID=1234595 RepID=M2U4M1_9SPHN|nr:N-acetylmuramoyl-L-alanine amidase [Pacificimonas flava]EMD82923.1 N-acetylmuramoyl-L-alanine amidase [Pacificimonas flava]MBB5280083.1 N-acetylmuramoyl-L-alanine amidase [Pacificimonas flava]